MIPTSFPEETVVLDPPSNMTLEECTVLPVHRTIATFEDNSSLPVIISCWKITKQELQQLSETGRVWLYIYGNAMPPVAITTENPFIKH